MTKAKTTKAKTNTLNETGSTMRSIDFTLVSIVNFTHSFSNELLTVQRTNRDENNPYTVALIVCYPSGDYGTWRFFSERRRAAMIKEKRMLIRQTESEKPGFGHMLGATILELPTELGKVEDLKKAREVEKQAKKEALASLIDSIASEVYASKKEAVARAKEIGVPQKYAVKNESGEWTVSA